MTSAGELTPLVRVRARARVGNLDDLNLVRVRIRVRVRVRVRVWVRVRVIKGQCAHLDDLDLLALRAVQQEDWARALRVPGT